MTVFKALLYLFWSTNWKQIENVVCWCDFGVVTECVFTDGIWKFICSLFEKGHLIVNTLIVQFVKRYALILKFMSAFDFKFLVFCHVFWS